MEHRLRPHLHFDPSQPRSRCMFFARETAVEIAMRLKMAEAAPALARWISTKEFRRGETPGNKLVINPAAIALAAIGDPAIPALRHVVDYGDAEQHALAVRTLCTIGTSKAKSVLRDDLSRESDPALQSMVKQTLQRSSHK